MHAWEWWDRNVPIWEPLAHNTTSHTTIRARRWHLFFELPSRGLEEWLLRVGCHKWCGGGFLRGKSVQRVSASRNKKNGKIIKNVCLISPWGAPIDLWPLLRDKNPSEDQRLGVISTWNHTRFFCSVKSADNLYCYKLLFSKSIAHFTLLVAHKVSKSGTLVSETFFQ